MNFVENNGKKVAAILCVASAFPVVATIYAKETAPGWHGDKYVNSDKTVAKGWKEIQGKSYYFDEKNGEVKKAKTKDAVVSNVSATVADDVETTVTDSTIAAIEEENARIDAQAAAQAEAEAVAAQTSEVYVAPTEVAAPEVQQVANVEVPVAETPVAEENVYVAEVAEQAVPVETVQVEAVEQPVAQEAPVVQEQAAPVEQVAPAAQPSSSLNANIANAAMGLVGVTNGYQCTDVAAMALQQAGISATSLWPAEMIAAYTTGVAQANPQAGNLIYYADGGTGLAHIAVYVGDGQAVHGNYNGQTVVAGAEVYGATSPIYYQVNG